MSDDELLEVPTDLGFEVYETQVGFIGVKQYNEHDGEQIVVVSPERVDRLIHFLRIAKDRVLTQRADAAAVRRDAPPLLNE